MTWQEALEKLTDDPHLWRYLGLTAEDNPKLRQRDAWRARVVELAGGKPPAQAYPSLATQATTAASAVVGFMRSGFALREEDAQAKCLEICRACEHYDAGQGRCYLCGCVASLKARLASEHCPIARW